MPIEEDEDAREDIIALQTAIDALPSADKSNRIQLLQNMQLIITRLQVMVEDEVRSLQDSQ